MYALWLVLTALQSLVIFDGRRSSVVLIGADRGWWLWCKIPTVNGTHRHHGKDEHAKTIHVYS